MSYILDALRKADQERSLGDVPDLETPHWSQRRVGPVRRWIWVVILLLIVNGALLAVLFSRDDGGAGSPGDALEVPQALQQDTDTKPRQPDGIPLKPLVRRELAITEPRQVAPPVVERPLAAKPASVAKPPQARSAPAESVQTGGSDIPEWNQLSLEFRSGFNPPRLDVHVYDDEPARRFILVELKRYVEGDTLNDGAKLEKIMPGSIQLYYQGTRFRIDR